VASAVAVLRRLRAGLPAATTSAHTSAADSDGAARRDLRDPRLQLGYAVALVGHEDLVGGADDRDEGVGHEA
jgi:hypothetical protein